MKSVFKNLAPRRGAPWLRPALLPLVMGACLLAPASARAQAVYWNQRELLGEFFRTSEQVTFRQFDLAALPEARAHITQQLGYTPARTRYTVYVATTAGRVDGYAIFDDELGQHLPISFAVKLSPSGTVARQEVVAYREARGDEIRDGRFRAQFVGKGPRDTVRAGDDIVAISGATISSRAMAAGVKRALVLLDVLVLGPERQASASARR